MSERGLGDKVAYHWIGEPGDTRTITYADLLREVSRTPNALLELGITTGDRVAIYMPMIPELPIAMLACARIGAPAHGHLRWLQRRGPRRPDQRRAGQARHHRRRRLAARQGDGPQAGRGRGPRQHPHHRAHARRPAGRRRARRR
ncbi:MAG: AMP-binding protein [Candidatus Limnocylindrales bacterium]